MTDHNYLCSSQTKRRGLGCGAGLHVRQHDVEDAGEQESSYECPKEILKGPAPNDSGLFYAHAI